MTFLGMILCMHTAKSHLNGQMSQHLVFVLWHGEEGTLEKKLEQILKIT